jgi:hypothetical protein
MVLFLHVDASYLSRSHARSVVGGYFFLVLGNENRPLHHIINGATHVFSSIIPCIVSSAGEAEYAALFAGAQHAASLRNIMADLGYPRPQPPTIIMMCDNTCALGIATATDSIKQKRSKAIDIYICASTGSATVYDKANLLSPTLNRPTTLRTILQKTWIQSSTNSSCNSWHQTTQNCSIHNNIIYSILLIFFFLMTLWAYDRIHLCE